MSKINRYVHFVLNIRIRESKKATYRNYIKFFRPCKKEDFEQNGIDMSEESVALKILRHRICPDIEKDDPIFEVIGGYTNEQFRQSISVELWKCSDEHDGNCKSQNEISKFLAHMFFTVYAVSDEVVFNEKAEVDLIAKDKFFL
jgi:hypothetical protein